MKVVIAIGVISYLLAVAAIDLSCITRAGQVGSCIARSELQSVSTDNTFCTDCANSLVDYYRDCTNRNDIDALLEGEPVHTYTICVISIIASRLS